MEIGDKAPEFALLDQDNHVVRLSEIVAGGGAAVFFYPKDGTPVCTREACAFRDRYQDFRKYNVKVVGVSSDGVESHRAFAGRHSLPFPLLWDRDGALRKAWGVPKALGLMPGRTTYVLDAGGVVRRVFTSQLAAERHVAEALEAVKAMQNA